MMARTNVRVDKTSTWTVEAKCLEHVSRWTFEDRGEARWFAEIARGWYCARCPTCATRDATNLTLRQFDVIVSCGWSDCDFAKRIPKPHDIAVRGSERTASARQARAEPFGFTAGGAPSGPCIGCHADSEFSILLACIGNYRPKYYIPNQFVRKSHKVHDDVVKAVPFCLACIGAVQHNLQDTIARLQHDGAPG